MLGVDLNPAFAVSAPVRTATTPGDFAVSPVSSETISAWARSERRKWPYSWPGRFQSEVYFPCPVTSLRSSRRPLNTAVIDVSQENARRNALGLPGDRTSGFEASFGFYAALADDEGRAPMGVPMITRLRPAAFAL